ncbi:MAG TPA: hypothetical protein ENK02_12090, partial [Planctomycetes bacterium]|nr:hypothetical protein [Planctomycetota bacterium]
MTKKTYLFSLSGLLLLFLPLSCGGGGGGSGTSTQVLEGESYQLTENQRIHRLAGYGIHKDAWLEDDPSTHLITNCYSKDQEGYDKPGVPFFKNGTDATFGMDLGFPTPIRGYPSQSGGLLYFFFGDTDPIYKPWWDSSGVVTKDEGASTMTESTVFGETPFQLGTSNGDSISYFSDTDPSDGLDMLHTLRNTEGSNTQYDTSTTGVLSNAFRSTVVRLNASAGSGPTYLVGSVTQHRQGMGQDFLVAPDVPGGILYLDNRSASDPSRQKEYVFNFRWYQPNETLLTAAGASGDLWKANYMLNSYTMIAVSTDLGLSWKACQQRQDLWPKPFSGWDPQGGSFLNCDWSNPVEGKFINLAFLEVSSSEFSYLPTSDPDAKARASDGKYVLIFGYGVGSNLAIHLACVPRERLIDLAESADTLGVTLEGVRYFGGLDSSGNPLWKTAESEAIPVCWVADPTIREELETHCLNHSDPSVKFQLIKESVGGAYTLSVQRVQTSFKNRSGTTVSFDRLVAVMDFGYSVLLKNLKTDSSGNTPKTISISDLTAADHGSGAQTTAQPGPVLFTCDPKYPWAWNYKDPSKLTSTNIGTTRAFRPLFFPKMTNDQPIEDNTEHDIGDAPGTVCGIRAAYGSPGGPHDKWYLRTFDPYATSKTGSE